MTDQRSYEDGRANRPMAPGTDQHDYNRGQQAREAAMGHNINATSEADNKQKTDWSTFWGPKVEVPGVAYTLILVSPFLFLVYPALGFTILAVMGATAGAMALLPEEYFYQIMVIGFILGVISFFPGLALEAKASQFRIYQHFRTFWRIFFFLIGPVILLTIQDHHTIGSQTATNASGEGLFMAIIITIIVHFVMRTLDRLYFPNLKEAKKILAMQEKGEPLKRNLFKRLFYGFLWIVPVVCALNVAIRLIVGAFLESEEIASFYEDYSVYIYVFDTIAWYLLCLGGILPGTAKTRKSFIDHSKLAGVASPRTGDESWSGK